MLGVPTILAARERDEWGPIVRELTAVTSGARILERTAVNAWEDPLLRRAVESTRPDTLIIAGLAIEHCVSLTALAAARAGHDVRVVVDVSGSFCARAAASAIRQLLQAGVALAGLGPLLTGLLDATAGEDSGVLSLALRHHLPASSICLPTHAAESDSGLRSFMVGRPSR
jgi:hypothetical protein